MKHLHAILLLFTLWLPFQASAQINENRLGAWYMYFGSVQFRESRFGVQGDIQFRNWNLLGDMEQLLLRGGFTYSPRQADIKFTLGYGFVRSEAFGPDTNPRDEHRIYQEALWPHHLGGRFYLRHRFRFEERLVAGQDFRTRFRYGLFMNVPLNRKTLEARTLYLALYDELFLNGQRNVGNGNTVEIFDRNRAYAALGYKISAPLSLQGGIMLQTTDNWQKPQLQLSAHHTF